MPNWCSNNLTLSNENVEEVDKLVKYIGQMDERSGGLFSYFRPIPENEEDWYTWNNVNWGTKWDVHDVIWDRIDQNTVHLTFDTAWSPPEALYNFLTNETEWKVDATYYECGFGFVGRYSEGEDACYTISDRLSLDDIPEDLLEEWNIREDMEGCEEEDEEEKKEREERRSRAASDPKSEL